VTGDDAALEARNRQIEALAASGRYPSGSYLPAPSTADCQTWSTAPRR
jgi:hypothetical protein